MAQKGAGIGAVAGGTIGAIIGKKAGNTAVGAIIGGAIGGTAGAFIGRRMDRQAAEIKQTIPNAEVIREGEGIIVKFDSGLLFDVDKAELKAAGLTVKSALGLGVSVDKRRRNASTEALNKNAQRLKVYKSKLIVFPRNPYSSKEKKGDTPKEQRAAGEQKIGRVQPLVGRQPRFIARKITKDEQSAEVVAHLRTTLMDQKLWGRREKRAKDKADAAKAPKREALADEADE